MVEFPFHQRPALFVGRNDDLLAVVALLQHQGAALVIGVSGVGKSELVREVAHRLVARRWVMPERVHFVALGNSSDAHGMRTSIGVALGISVEQLPSQDHLADSWLMAQLPPRTLLILDEAENAIHSGGRAVYNLLELLAQQPRCYLLVTSQNDIGSPHLPAYNLTRLTPQAALQLFVRTANLRPAEWAQLDLTDLDAVLTVVDRLPRAVELVAKVWRFRRNTDLKTVRADLERHADQILQDPRYPDEVKSVTVGIQLAYERLHERNPDAAMLFAQLALFPGGLAEAGVVPIFGESAAALLPLIEDQSLIERPFADLLYLPAPLQSFGRRQLSMGTE
ncbi:MAG: ATP-binding protein, partial [Caldilineaceae bacterium]|nr:ATP-binding protein [Caldilineaceae bacterium]